ncbi:MAG: XdhC family protein [Fimbriimonadaceae bacterium]|nr:XdhC family protein [Fimbriimonadaceae bacterium]
MRDELAALDGWRAEGRRYALAVVVETWGSSPRPTGSVMAIREDGLTVGSVSAGCVEGAVIEAALRCLATGQPADLRFDRVPDATAWSFGLSCGGSIRVWVRPDTQLGSPARAEFEQAIRERRPAVLIAELNEPVQETVWFPDSGGPSPLAEGAHVRRRSELVEAEGRSLFLHVAERPPRLLVVGASHLAVHLVRLAKALEFETIVVDPRSALAVAERFDPPPDCLAIAWPDRAFEEIGLDDETYVVALSHDAKIDDPALAIALRASVSYVGALGSRSTQEGRRGRLREMGLREEEVGRLHGPVGLPIGARTPAEIAVSILAEIVQARRTRA